MAGFNSTKGLSHMCFYKTRARSPLDPKLVRVLDFPCSHWEKPFQSTSPSSYSNSSQSISEDKSCTVWTLHFFNMISLKEKLLLKGELIICHTWDWNDQSEPSCCSKPVWVYSMEHKRKHLKKCTGHIISLKLQWMGTKISKRMQKCICAVHYVIWSYLKSLQVCSTDVRMDHSVESDLSMNQLAQFIKTE